MLLRTGLGEVKVKRGFTWSTPRERTPYFFATSVSTPSSRAYSFAAVRSSTLFLKHWTAEAKVGPKPPPVSSRRTESRTRDARKRMRTMFRSKARVVDFLWQSSLGLPYCRSRFTRTRIHERADAVFRQSQSNHRSDGQNGRVPPLEYERCDILKP